MYLDLRRDGVVRLVLHELLHVYMSAHFRIEDFFVYELSEPPMLAWETTVYNHLHSPARVRQLESWAKAIDRKLKG
jgi:hypothetical protein